MDTDNPASSSLQNFLVFLQTPFGLAALVGFFLATIAAIAVPRTRWILLTLLFWTGMFGYAVGATPMLTNRLITPLEIIRQYSRTLVAGLTLVLVIPSLISMPGWRTRLISPVAVCFLAFELFFCLREILSGDLERSPAAALVFVITFVVLCFGLPRWLQSMDDINRAVATIAWAAGLFCLCTLAQAAVDRNAMVVSGRLIGTTGNPQTAALVLGTGLAPLCYLVARPSQAVLKRFIYGGLAALNAGFLAWTGSRTGVIIAMVGLVITFRYRLHRLFLLGVCTGAFLLMILANFSDTTMINGHLLSVENTRQHIWSAQLDAYLGSPIMGDLVEGKAWGYGENSYLAAASRYGTVGILPLLAAMGLCIVELIRLNANKRYLREDAMLVDLVTGCMIAIAIGACFEGYLLASFSFPTYCMLAYMALIGALRDVATARYQESLALGHTQSWPQYADTAEPVGADYGYEG